MPDSPEFDACYLESRHRLVLQAYALTGDLPSAAGAVRDAFISARQHWRKVRLFPDLEEWVRPRAWAAAQRRTRTRLSRGQDAADPEQAGVLDALSELPDAQRRAFLLTHLVGLGGAPAARELQVTQERFEHHLSAATHSLSERLDLDAPAITAVLDTLLPLVQEVDLPSTSTLHQAGRRRRNGRALLGGVALVAVAVLSGVFVTSGYAQGPVEADREDTTTPVTEQLLLTPEQLPGLAPPQSWQERGSDDNTQGDGLNSVCQTSRFADPQGVGALVRRFRAPGTPRQRLVQTVEISADPVTAAQAYDVTLGWFAGCTAPRVQLLNTYQVTGLGTRANVLRLRLPGPQRRTYVVGVAQNGSLTVSTVHETIGGRPVEVDAAVATLGAAVGDLCAADAAGTCEPIAPAVAPVLPPPSGEAPGTLAVTDLPPVGTIRKPWVGTKQLPGDPNLAATNCDRANFVAAGAPGATTRTYLVPRAKLPKTFGLTQTVGAFGTPRAAKAFVESVVVSLGRCEDKDLGATVSNDVLKRDAYRGSEFALWRIESQINDDQETIGFWMGVARVGNTVTQVNFVAAPGNDLDEDTFRAVVSRARDRLFEIVPSAAPPSAPAAPGAPPTTTPTTAPTTAADPR